MRILLAEDEAKVAEHIRRGLCEAGYAVDVAADGAEALWLAETHPYDAMVLDVMMPGQDGITALRQMRRPGSLVSFEAKGGSAAGEKVMNYFARKDVPMELAVSLGSTITYIQHPASMTHAVVPEADRLARGITPGLIRLSVGLEGAQVLIGHLDRALSLT